MKKFKILFTFLIALTFLVSCDEDERGGLSLDNVAAPSDISALFSITQDNTGLVTITPNGTAVTSFEVFFGDAGNTSEVVAPGGNVQNIYDEGVYTVTIVATNVNGETTTFTQELTVSFLAPENLVVDITPVAGDVFSINIAASADLETYFAFYPGVDPDEDPILFMEADSPIMYTYDAVGDYDVTVVALSGGAATTEYTETISIVNPLLLPINFEDATLNYAFTDFGDVASSVVANPFVAGINTSATVGQSLKPSSAPVWGGTFLQLDDPIDFSSFTFMNVKVWSPTGGITVRLKVENATDPNVFVEVDQTVAAASTWETLTFDLSTVDQAQEYHKIVLFFDFGNTGTDDTYYFDDIALTTSSGGTEPTVGAPDPTENDVISLFSDVYTDVPVDTWNTVWSQATFEDVTVAGNPTKKYTDLGFNGIETIASPVDASGMSHFHMDIWTPNMTAFRIKLVDFLGDGFQGPNGDTEAELSYTPLLGQWFGLDIPLSDFTDEGMTAFTDLNQYIISGEPFGDGIVFIDNVYFYNNVNEPLTAAPTPTLPQANVISMYSDAYTNVPIDTWNTVWSQATFEEVNVAGDATLKYTNVNFNGAETVATPIDASGMTHIHLDIWTPNMVEFRVKLVDFLGDGFQGGNGDTEAELDFAPNQAQWVSLDIPLADFTALGMTAFSDINQFIISGDPSGFGTVFIDNIYFHN